MAGTISTCSLHPLTHQSLRERCIATRTDNRCHQDTGRDARRHEEAGHGGHSEGAIDRCPARVAVSRIAASDHPCSPSLPLLHPSRGRLARLLSTLVEVSVACLPQQRLQLVQSPRELLDLLAFIQVPVLIRDHHVLNKQIPSLVCLHQAIKSTDL